MNQQPNIDRMPRPNLEAEQELIGAVLRSPAIIAEAIAMVPIDAFGDGRHATIWNAMAHLYREGKTPDLVGVGTWLGKGIITIGGGPYLARIYDDCLTAANWKQRASEVLQRASMRRLFCAALDLYRDVIEGGKPETIAQTHQDSLHGAIFDQDAYRPIPISQTIVGVLEAIHERRNKRSRGRSTGIIPLDDVTGGLEDGSIYVLAARPGNGKSALAMQIAAHIAMSAPALFFSLEMATDQLVERLLASYSGIENSLIRKALLSDDEFTRVGAAAVEIPERLEVWDAVNSTVARIDGAVARQCSKLKPGVVVVDYLQLVTPASRKEPREEQIAGIMRGLKQMVKRWHVPLLLVSQLNRDVEGRFTTTPRLADLRGSGAIEQDADFIMFIHPVGETRPTQLPCKLTVAKNRHGQCGGMDLLFDRKIVHFSVVMPTIPEDKDF